MKDQKFIWHAIMLNTFTAMHNYFNINLKISKIKFLYY